MTAPSQHPSTESLNEFARATETRLVRFDVVRIHLESGCRECARVVGRAMAGQDMVTAPVAPREKWLEPRIVQQYYGVRTGVLSDITETCTAGPYEIEVLVREYEGQDVVEFAGQVTWSDRVYEPVVCLDIGLIDGATLECGSRGMTDDLGEFNLQGPRAATHGLRLGKDAAAPCVVLWEGDL